MKLCVFVSESVKLSDLVPITDSSKIFNAVNGITGIFSYNHGYYLQVIEGEDDHVDRLAKNLWVDSRHQNISEVLSVEIDQRFFSDWSMNLIPLLKRNQSFLSFIDYLNSNLDLLSHQQISLMKLFHNISESKLPTSAGEAIPLKPLKYSVNEWPDGEVINASSSLLSLCGTLINNPTNFRMLVEQKIHGPKDEVRLMLNQLNKAGILKVTQAESVVQKGPVTQFENLHKVRSIEESRNARRMAAG